MAQQQPVLFSNFFEFSNAVFNTGHAIKKITFANILPLCVKRSIDKETTLLSGAAV